MKVVVYNKLILHPDDFLIIEVNDEKEMIGLNIVGIVPEPTAYLHLAAGTTTTSTADALYGLVETRIKARIRSTTKTKP